jgi:hypothetical protein
MEFLQAFSGEKCRKRAKIPTAPGIFTYLLVLRKILKRYVFGGGGGN